jgi:hypothetical protein
MRGREPGIKLLDASCVFVRARVPKINLFAICTRPAGETLRDSSELCWTFAINASVMPTNRERWKHWTQVHG